MNEEFYNRQQFIYRNNELKKEPNIDSFIEGNKKKVVLDQKLEELSLKNGVLLSGNVVRQNVLRASSSNATSLNNIVDSEVYRPNNKENTSKMNSNNNNFYNSGNNIINNINNRFNKNI